MVKNQSKDAIDYKNVWIIIAAFNEGNVIYDVVKNVIRTFPNIVVVDDCSEDKTSFYAKKAGAYVVVHPLNMGQGAALRTGMEYALMNEGCEYLVTFDADGQHRLEDIQNMVVKMENNNLDIILGSRFLGQAENMPPVRRTILKFAVWFTNITSGVTLTDTHNGLRLFKSDVARKLKIKQNRMAHASEITNEISNLNLRYTEVPVNIIYTEYSLAKGQKMSNSLRILGDLFMQWLIR